MDRKILIMILLGMFIIPMLSATIDNPIQSLGTFEVNTQIDLKQICGNTTSPCDGCNITSATYPNSSIIIQDVEMQKRESEFNYTLTANQNIATGTLNINGFCFAGSQRQEFAYTSTVTPTGTILDTSESILYSFVIIFSFILFIFSLVFAIKLPFSNPKDEVGNITGINYFKYLKLISIWFCHLFFIYFMSSFLAIINGFVTLTATINIVTIMYRLSYILYYPMTLFMIFAFTILIYKDIFYNKAIKEHGKAFIEEMGKT